MWSYRKDTDVSNSDNLPQIRPNSRESFKREIIKLPEEEFNVRTELLERESFISKTNVSNAGKQNIIEIQEQLRFFKEELARKDRLISQLMSIDVPRPKISDNIQLSDSFSDEQIAAFAAAKSEAASLQLKVDGLQAHLREMQAQLEIREEKIKELKVQIECSHETEAKLNLAVQSLRGKLGEYEAHSSGLEGAVGRTEIVIQALQQDNRTAQEAIIDLEKRLRNHMEERENAERSRDSIVRKWNDLVSQIKSIFHITEPTDNSVITAESLIAKISEVVQENVQLKGKVAVLKDYAASAELEVKASRETINRLAEETDSHQHHLSRNGQALEAIQLERDSAVLRQRELEREIDILKERVEASQRAWAATKRDLDNMTLREHEYHNQEVTWRTEETASKSFKESLANLLSDGYQNLEPYEEAIKDRIKNLLLSLRDKAAHIDLLENKIQAMTHQLESEVGHYRHVDKQARKSEVIIAELEDRLRKAESELAAGGVLRDGMRIDKHNYLQFLERLCQALRMEPLAADVGMDMACDAIIYRVQQVMKHDSDAHVDSRTQVYQLQRKIRTLKEQVDSRDTHLDLLRKKVVTLEERLTGKDEAEREKNEEFVKNRKLLKLIEKYKNELVVVQHENQELRARLSENADVRTQTREREKAIESLEAQVGQLEHIQEKQAEKIAKLKQNAFNTDKFVNKKKETTNKTISMLTSELNIIRTSLEETKQREKQLLNLRQVLAKMLGLDVNSLAVPDYEIIARLERLILANQTTTASALVMDSMISDVEEGFMAGYQNTPLISTNGFAAHNPHYTAYPDSRSRSRSPSKYDPRSY